MAQMGWVDIVHPEYNLTATVLESTVPTWELQGWTRADNGSEGVVAPEPSGALTPPPEQPVVVTPGAPTEE